MGRWVWLPALLCVMFVVAAQQLGYSGEVDKGLTWLRSQVQADGTVAGENASQALPVQVRTEVLHTLTLFESQQSGLADRVGSEPQKHTELQARKALSMRLSGRDAHEVIAELGLQQNADGGFGSRLSYSSNALDTAYALLALSSTPDVDPARVTAALTWLRTDNPSGLGSFSYGLRFAGQQFDAITNSHYNYFRDYDAGSGRFLQSDPIGLLGGLTTFQYTLTGPLNEDDPSGLAPRERRRGNCNVYGTPQKTGPGHWFSSARWALCQIQSGATDVWFHSAMSTICGRGNDLRKPDAAARMPNGDLNMCEVCSGKGRRRQSAGSQQQKLGDMRQSNNAGPGQDDVIP